MKRVSRCIPVRNLILSDNSLTMYSASPKSRDEWIDAIREAKSALLINLNHKFPNTTLTSSTSSAHLRAMLRALPFPEDEEHPQNEKRLKVDHFTPPVWVPDHKAPTCMRCGNKFGWLVRRHHCRLCGRCVCSTCSSKVISHEALV